jgi:beta-lactam-binding protein with PASTA domain
VLLGAVAVAAAPTAPAQTLGPAPPEDPGVAGVVHCTVPAVRGVRLAAAKRRVTRARCTVTAVMRKHSSVRRGRVALVVPRAGTILAEGTGVLLVVSAGR